MSYLVDGTAEEISFASYAAIEGLDLQTWVGWVYLNGDGGGGFQRWIDKRHSGNAGHVIWRANGTEWQYYDYRWSGSVADWTFPEPTIGQWVHCAFTYDASSTANDPLWYLDGVSQTVTRNVAPVGTHTGADTKELMVGNRSTGSRQLDGKVAEHGVYKRILSDSEIKGLFSGRTPDQYDGLVLYGDFNGNAKNRVAGSDGVVTGATLDDHAPVHGRAAQIIPFPYAAPAPPPAGIPIFRRRIEARTR